MKDFARIAKPLNDLLVGNLTHEQVAAGAGQKKKKKKVIP